MNILHCICSLNTGGTEKLLIELVNNANLGKEDTMHICITNKSYDEKLLNEIDNNINVYLLDRPESSKNIMYILNFIKLVKKNNIDIIHCHNRGSYKFALICKIVMGLKIKIVYTIHATGIYNNLSNKFVFLDKMFIDKFIAISNSVKCDIESRKISSNKIELIYNGINIEKFYNESKKITDINNIRVGCVSRIVPEKKGQDILIKAIESVKLKYPNIKCIFAGDVPMIKQQKDTDSLELLKKEVSKLGLEDNVEFIGNILDVPKFLSSIDIFVLPSRKEGFGLVVVEAMASKRPIIASNIDGPREIIGEEYGFLFKVEDYKELGDKIIYVIENYNSIDFEKNYKYAKEMYSIEKISNMYYKLYESIVCN